MIRGDATHRKASVLGLDQALARRDEPQPGTVSLERNGMPMAIGERNTPGDAVVATLARRRWRETVGFVSY